MKDRFKHIKKVHFAEIPSIKREGYHLSVENGLHIILTNDKNQEHKLYLSSSFMTDMLKYELYDENQFTKRDLLAFHVYRFLKTKSFTNSQWKVLYKLLSYSNNTFQTIKKFIILMISYYCL